MEAMDLIVNAHKKSLNGIHLVASETWLPEEARIPYILDIYSRYVYDSDTSILNDQNGLVGQLPDFAGTELLNDLEIRCNKLLCKMLDAKYSNVKAISGLNMMISVLGSLVLKNETLFSLPIEAGGHSATKYIAQRIGLQHKFIPFIKGTLTIDLNKFSEMIDSKDVKMIYIDLMNVISPINIQGLRDITGKKTIICYDASHVLGLILGGKFQDPLKEGADILIGSTHKTFPGPHKGVFVTNNRWYFMLYNLNHVLFISHTHIADAAALTIMLEKGEKYYCEYAEDVIKNAEVLAKTMIAQELKVHWDSSHQVWIDCGKSDITSQINECFSNNIYLNKITIPFNGHNGVRIGVQEVTLYGFDQSDMVILGNIISKIFLNDDLVDHDIQQLHNLINKRKKVANSSFRNLLLLSEKYGIE